MAEQREENKKLRAWQRQFFAFSISAEGVPGVSYAVFPDRQAISLFVFSTRHRGRLCGVSQNDSSGPTVFLGQLGEEGTIYSQSSSRGSEKC
jgi:hypothetical protein